MDYTYTEIKELYNDVDNERDYIEQYLESVNNGVLDSELDRDDIIELVKEFGAFKFSDWGHYGLKVIESDSGEFAIGSDDEADDAWDEVLDNYLEDFIYPEIPQSIKYYFNDEAWKTDAKYDGRGHFLSAYNGEEISIGWIYAYRLN